MRLSQGHLKGLGTCPRKFQHIYLDQFAPPTDLALLEKMAVGSQFHLLLQQRSLGLPIESLLAGDPRLQGWLEQFEQQAGGILALGEAIVWQQSEQMRTIAIGEHVLTAVYDLVLLGQTRGKVLDWKTYPLPRQSQWLQADWQTKLYLYILRETTGLATENLSMAYWFFQAGEAQSLTISYSEARHREIGAELQELGDQLSGWLGDYEARGVNFPQVNDRRVCQDCAFAIRCERGAEVGETMAWEAIEEVVL
jgi:hypothetical protein